MFPTLSLFLRPACRQTGRYGTENLPAPRLRQVGRKPGGFTMGINELFDGIAKVVERFAEELAEQKLLEKEQKNRTRSESEI